MIPKREIAGPKSIWYDQHHYLVCILKFPTVAVAMVNVASCVTTNDHF